MKDRKEKLLNKLVKKDYNNLLEELLESKTYDENVKSLILSMCYKIETAYKDYKAVKKDVLSKEQYMKRIFYVIQDKCEEINFIKKDSEKSSVDRIVDKQNKKINCYPIEKDILYCISQIGKQDNIVKHNNVIIQQCLTSMLNQGNNINTCEPIRDFNGFSWNIISQDIENITYNLIYQNLLILIGNKFLEEWINNNKFVINYLESLENHISKKYSEDLQKEIIEKIIKIAILQENSSNKELEEQAKEEKENIEQEYLNFQDSSKYLVELGNKKKNLAKKIKKIDQTINDRDLLDIEYEKRNEKLPLEKKIFSMRVLKKILQEEREKLILKMEEYANLMNPNTFLKKYEEIKENMKYFQVLDCKNIQESIYENIISLQKSILEVFKIKIEKANEKQDIIDLINEFRYYSQIPISIEKRIFQEELLKEQWEKTGEDLIRKATEQKVIIEISSIEKINLDIMKKIYTSRIISLENISIKIFKEENIWKCQFFDEDIAEITVDIEEIFEKKDLKVKEEKKIKLIL